MSSVSLLNLTTFILILEAQMESSCGSQAFDHLKSMTLFLVWGVYDQVIVPAPLRQIVHFQPHPFGSQAYKLWYHLQI